MTVTLQEQVMRTEYCLEKEDSDFKTYKIQNYIN